MYNNIIYNIFLFYIYKYIIYILIFISILVLADHILCQDLNLDPHVQDKWSTHYIVASTHTPFIQDHERNLY